MLIVTGVAGTAPGVKAQAAHGHGLVLSLFGHFGLNDDGLCPGFVLRQGRQQLCAKAARAVGGHHGKIVQLADGTALRAHHEQVGGQRLPVKHAPGVGKALGLAGQDHTQRLELPGGKVAAHFLQIHVGQLAGGQQPPGKGLVHTMRVPFWITALMFSSLSARITLP